MPGGSIEAYKAILPWSEFLKIVKIPKPEYTLTYFVDGEEYKSFKIEESASVTPEAAPTMEGYTFSGWSDIPETMPAHDVTVTGSFSINSYKLTYMLDGEEFKSVDVEYKASVTPEAEPTKEGYVFSGWSDIPETMPAHDVVVTGTFIEPITITAKSYTVEYGEELPAFEFTSEGATIEGSPAITCEATSKSPVGTYPIVITKGSVANYNDTYVNGTLTIEKAPLTITAQDYIIKQGEALPTFEATYEGFKNEETADVLTTLPTLSTTATSASEPGEYEITVSSAEAQNYEISYVAGKLTITEASAILNISVDHPVDIYDLQGNKVRSKATSLKGLRKGVYIINGSKVVVK